MRRLVLLLLTAAMITACSGVSTADHEQLMTDLQEAETTASTLQSRVDAQAAEIEQLESRNAALEAGLATGSEQQEALSEELAAALEVNGQLRELLGSTGECGAYLGVVCQGYVTDAAGVLEDREALEMLVAELVGSTGHEIAVVVVPTTGGIGIERFANELGNTWGVGNADRNDGVVVLIDIGSRMTWVTSGSGLDLGGQYETIAATGDIYFIVGDWDGGIEAIVGALRSALPASA